jgi:hypothetical protein
MNTTSPSLCIPRVFSNISREKIFKVFQQIQFGVIDHIDMIPIRNDNRNAGSGGGGGSYQRVFIHFKSWNPEANMWRERLLAGKEIKIVYHDIEPYFWKVSANRSVTATKK